jgi:hypothetical protein
MSELWSAQTADIDVDVGLSRFVIRERYGQNGESAVKETLIFPVTMDAALSPPLSETELTDLQIAEQEFASGQAETYENAQDLITALHSARERYRREAGGH